MNRQIVLAIALGLGIGSVTVHAKPPAKGAAAAAPEASATFKTEQDRMSYVIGASVGRNFKKQEIELNPDQFLKGLKDALGSGKLLVNETDFTGEMNRLQGMVRQKMAAIHKHDGDLNRKQGEEYLAANGKKEGVVTLPSGLQYKILKAGDGKKPSLSDTVSVNYRGTLLDGTQFDASAAGEPRDMVVVQTVPGFREALQLMPVGSKWQIAVPGKLAYGARGIGTQIGPDQALLFDIELVGIKDVSKPATQAEPAKP